MECCSSPLGTAEQVTESGPEWADWDLKAWIEKNMKNPRNIDDQNTQGFSDTIYAVTDKQKRSAICQRFRDGEKKSVLHIMAEFSFINHLKILLSSIGKEDVIDLLKSQDKRGQTPLHIAACAKSMSHELVQGIINFIDGNDLARLLVIPNKQGRYLWKLISTDTLLKKVIPFSTNSEDLMSTLEETVPLGMQDIQQLFESDRIKRRRCIVPYNQKKCKSFALLLHCYDDEASIPLNLEGLVDREQLILVNYTRNQSKLVDFFCHAKTNCAYLTIWMLAGEDKGNIETILKTIIKGLEDVMSFVPVIIMVQLSSSHTETALSEFKEELMRLNRRNTVLYVEVLDDSQKSEESFLWDMAAELKKSDGSKDIKDILQDLTCDMNDSHIPKRIGSILSLIEPRSASHVEADAPGNNRPLHSFGGNETVDNLAMGDGVDTMEEDKSLCSGIWRKEEKVGEGGYGIVFLYGHYKDPARKIAVKQYHSQVESQEFVRSIKTLKICNDSKFIVEYLWAEDILTSLVMEFMPGGSIEDAIALEINKRLSNDKARLYTKQILAGLEFMHGCKIIHRDLKCSNVLLDAKKDKVKLSDFDTSKLFEKLDASIKLSVQTNTGEKGSYYWMAPEVLCRGNKGEPGYHPEYGFRADIWSVGATVYEMLVGKHLLHKMSTAGAINFLSNYEDNKFVDLVDENKVSALAYKFLQSIFVKDYEEARPRAEDLRDNMWLSEEGTDVIDSHPIQSTEEVSSNHDNVQELIIEGQTWNRVDELGQGWFGVVNLFKNAEEKAIAVKWLKSQDNTPITEKQHDDFKKEMETLKTLEHDHIVRYIAYVDDPPSLCMEYIDGESLMHLVQNKIQLNQRDTKEYSRHILLGLEYLHNRDPSIIHRDLNCSNVIYDFNKRTMRIMDFGVAKDQKLPNLNADTWNKHTGMIGTEQFMAPEMVYEYKGFACNHYGRRVDIWSFGVLVVFMLTGEYALHDLTWEEHGAMMIKYNDECFDQLNRLLALDDQTQRFLRKIFVARENRADATELLRDSWFAVEASG